MSFLEQYDLWPSYSLEKLDFEHLLLKKLGTHGEWPDPKGRGGEFLYFVPVFIMNQHFFFGVNSSAPMCE
jgi:hypothetical protein